jgi:hypothetical protein
MYRLKVTAVDKWAVHRDFATDKGNISYLATNFSIRKCQILWVKCNHTIKTTKWNNTEYCPLFTVK